MEPESALEKEAHKVILRGEKMNKTWRTKKTQLPHADTCAFSGSSEISPLFSITQLKSSSQKHFTAFPFFFARRCLNEVRTT